MHDYFGDMRGSDVESQFQIAALMLSINDHITFDPIEITPE